MTAVLAVTTRASESAARQAGVTIRFSKSEADIAARVALARRAWEEGGDRDLSFDGDMVGRAIERKLERPEKHCALQAERGDTVVGVDYSTTGACTVTLPAVTILDTGGNAQTNAISIDTAGADTIKGDASTTIDFDYGALTLVSNGADFWFIR